jgi:Inner membrane protein YgaP-like, transmembrane domain
MFSVNLGIFDRIARAGVGLALIGFAIGSIAPGTGWNWIGWIGVLPILSGLIGICPVYKSIGYSTVYRRSP